MAVKSRITSGASKARLRLPTEVWESTLASAARRPRRGFGA